MRTLAKFLLIALCVTGIAGLIPGIEVYSFWSALWVAVILSILNLFVKPVLIILTIPVTILTFGLFLLVINGFMIWLASALLKGFIVETFMRAIIFGILLSVATYLVERVLPPRRYYY